MARPTKDPADALTYRLNARMTDAEGQQLEQDAAAAGLTVSDYVAQKLALRAKPRQIKATPERAAWIKALGTLGHIRADLNQVLKDRWAYKFVTPERVEGIFAALDRIAHQIHTDLER